ncbi:MAG: hypothetical protein RL543_358, partial [Pseudomonadota bacterium]
GCALPLSYTRIRFRQTTMTPSVRVICLKSGRDATLFERVLQRFVTGGP